MTQKQGITTARRSFSWQVKEVFTTVQGAPFVTDSESGAVVDPIDVRFLYEWDSGVLAWYLLSVEVVGRRREQDGTYPDEGYTTVEFDDPVHGDEGDGKAPQWLVDWAFRNMVRLLVPVGLGLEVRE